MRKVDDGPGDPDELLAEYNQLQQEIADVQARLKLELGQAIRTTREAQQSPSPPRGEGLG